MSIQENPEKFDPDAIRSRLLKAWEPSREALRSIHPSDRMMIEGTNIGSPTSPALISACAQILSEYPTNRREILDIAKDLIARYFRSHCEIRRGGIPATIEVETGALFADFLVEVICEETKTASKAPASADLTTDVSTRVQEIL